MTRPNPLRLDSPRTRLDARAWLRDYGIGSLIAGDVLWVNGTDGTRMRVNDGDSLALDERTGAFSVVSEVEA